MRFQLLLKSLSSVHPNDYAQMEVWSIKLHVHEHVLFHYRYVAAERYSEALDILQSGACTQLKHEQVKASCIFSAYVIAGLDVLLAFMA